MFYRGCFTKLRVITKTFLLPCFDSLCLLDKYEIDTVEPIVLFAYVRCRTDKNIICGNFSYRSSHTNVCMLLDVQSSTFQNSEMDSTPQKSLGNFI